MTHKWLSRLRRWNDRRKKQYPVMLTDYQAMLMTSNYHYRARTTHIRTD